MLGIGVYLVTLFGVTLGANELWDYLTKNEGVLAVFDEYVERYKHNTFCLRSQKIKDINAALEKVPEDQRAGVILYFLLKLPIKKPYPEALKELFLLHILASGKKIDAATTINDTIFGTLTREEVQSGRQAILHLIDRWNANIPPDMPDGQVRMVDLFTLLEKNRAALNGDYQEVKAAWDKLPPWD